MAVDFFHEGWDEVEQWGEKLGHLSLTTFDLWRIFARSSSGMAALAFRLSHLPWEFVRKFPIELPFCWEAVTYQDWKQAIENLRTVITSYSIHYTKLYEVFPGNTADVSTIKRIRKDLRGWKLGRALFVADSGMNSSANREELARACGKYLLATRMATVAEIKKEVLSQPGRFTTFTDNLQAKEVVIGDGERRRRYILCFV